MQTRLTMIVVSLVFMSVLMTGCASTPSAAQIANADYGPAPSESVARSKAEAYILERLKDPENAQIRWGTIHKGWYRSGLGKTRFGWMLHGEVNARNSYVGHVGDKMWHFFFRGDQMVGDIPLDGMEATHR